jgi:hypothetical protein
VDLETATIFALNVDRRIWVTARPSPLEAPGGMREVGHESVQMEMSVEQCGGSPVTIMTGEEDMLMIGL